jgi:hypothetical protein
MQRICLTILFATATIAVPLIAQPGAAPIAPQAAVESFLRVAATVGKSATALKLLLPAREGSRTFDLQLTAAHAIRVSVASPRSENDSLGEVLHVLLDERVSDTLALARRVRETMQLLQQRFGPPDRCGDPLGPPAYLFAPQEVTRLWRSGPGGTPLTLRWWLTKDAQFGITLSVSRFPDEQAASLSCNAKMP